MNFASSLALLHRLVMHHYPLVAVSDLWAWLSDARILRAPTRHVA
jgi:hypothetical protein